VTARRTLGSGPAHPAGIRAAEADLLDGLPGDRLADLDEMRARGLFGGPRPVPQAERRVLGPGGGE
jgi:hypothetical protein